MASNYTINPNRDTHIYSFLFDSALSNKQRAKEFAFHFFYYLPTLCVLYKLHGQTCRHSTDFRTIDT